MYLWDANILRHFGEQHPNLNMHIQRVGWEMIALPSVVIAEVMRGRAEYALKATSDQAAFAHRLLIETYEMLQNFNIVTFDERCVEVLKELQQAKSLRKRYADALIAATVIAGNHTLVTRNYKHFVDMLPVQQLEK